MDSYSTYETTICHIFGELDGQAPYKVPICNILRDIEFPDHYKYSENELLNHINKSIEKNSILLTTEKDYLRINENYRKSISFLKISVEIKNRDEFIKEMKKVI